MNFSVFQTITRISGGNDRKALRNIRKHRWFTNEKRYIYRKEIETAKQLNQYLQHITFGNSSFKHCMDLALQLTLWHRPDIGWL